tara:strand:+ start:620 stop:853 length:234 start_codon:yes stop_codon:yes gene_type:complete
MKKTENNFRKLLNEYSSLKDELMEFEENLHDGMYYDIQGYWEEFDENFIYYFDDLYNQVKACRNILKGYKELKYIFC